MAANDKILKDSRLVAAFIKLSGFSAYYKIYYEAAKSLTIYESYLAYDKLRNKQYIISFNSLILAAKKVWFYLYLHILNILILKFIVKCSIISFLPPTFFWRAHSSCNEEYGDRSANDDYKYGF